MAAIKYKMGKAIMDKFTLLHMAMGVVFFFLSVPLSIFIVLQILFEIVENSAPVRPFIQNYIDWWPGGKPSVDSLVNAVSDVIAGTLGWLLAYYVSK